MKQLLENLLKEWWNHPLPKIIPREIDLYSFHNLPVKKVVSVVGFRRSGKTYSFFSLAEKIGKENTIYINLEDERLPKNVQVLTNLLDVLTELSSQRPYTLLMDEIQNIDGWENWARRVIETTPHKLFITGSSSKLGSSELPTQLRGRSLTIEIKPLNFREFLAFKEADAKLLPKPELLHYTREYLTYGGFPEITLVDEGKKFIILDEYYKTFVTRDVVERHKIRNTQLLQNLLKLLLNSSLYTASKLTNSLRSLGIAAGKATVIKYIDYLQESFFISNVELHTPSIKNRLKAAKKLYLIDNFFVSKYSTDFSQNLGRLMENVVANKLANKFYWKDYQGHEVDFVIREKEENNKLIQVSFVSNLSEIKERELKNLVIASKELKCDNLNLVSWDLDGKIKKNGKIIKLLPLTEFLLSADS